MRIRLLEFSTEQTREPRTLLTLSSKNENSTTSIFDRTNTQASNTWFVVVWCLQLKQLLLSFLSCVEKAISAQNECLETTFYANSTKLGRIAFFTIRFGYESNSRLVFVFQIRSRIYESIFVIRYS